MTRRRRIPKTKYPMHLEKAYLGSMNRFILSWRKTAEQFLDMYLKSYVTGGALTIDADTNQNDPHKIERIASIIALMIVTIKNNQSEAEFEKLATQFVLAVNSFSLQNCTLQANVLRIQALESNPTIQAIIKAKIAENTSLITSLRDKYIAQLRNDIYRSISNGGGVTQLTQDIVKRTGMSYNHAKLIANDQTGDILAQLNKIRAKSAGFEKYQWQSMEDDRVRPKHQELDRKIFKYDDPDGGDNGMLPGEPINCRCVANPVYDDD